MTREQCAIAVIILNSYAHQYLGLALNRVLVAGGHGPAGWMLIVAIDETTVAVADLDAAKRLIDELK